MKGEETNPKQIICAPHGGTQSRRKLELKRGNSTAETR
jgi:hypothetical protein